MLLNYLKFYQMTKKEVIDKANAHLTKYNEALRIKNELETKIEKNKKRAQKVSAIQRYLSLSVAHSLQDRSSLN